MERESGNDGHDGNQSGNGGGDGSRSETGNGDGGASKDDPERCRAFGVNATTLGGC